MGNQERSVGSADETSRPTPSGREHILGDGIHLAIKDPGPHGQGAKFTIQDETVMNTSEILHAIRGWPASRVYEYLRARGWVIHPTKRRGT